jgi:hypothetical protein
MAIDTLAYVKALEAAGVDRRTAEAQVQAMVQYVLPDLVTKDYLDRRLEQLEHRLTVLIGQTAHDQTRHLFSLMLGVVGLMDAVLFVLLRFVH